MAAQLGDLALKVWQQQNTPIAWRGFVTATVPKGGPQDLCESWRGVLTASTMGKSYAKKLRGDLLPYLEPRAHGSQYGGLPARNTEMATHHARTIMLSAKRDRQACAALFMDVKNAFPSLAHVMVFGEQNLVSRIAKVDSLVQELPEHHRAHAGCNAHGSGEIRPSSQHGPKENRIDAYAPGKGHARGAQIFET